MEEMEAIIPLVRRWKRSTKCSTKESSSSSLWRTTNARCQYYTFPAVREPYEGETVYTIDLYHAAAILIPRGTKSFVFARPASHWMRGWTGKIFCFSIV